MNILYLIKQYATRSCLSCDQTLLADWMSLTYAPAGNIQPILRFYLYL